MDGMPTGDPVDPAAGTAPPHHDVTNLLAKASAGDQDAVSSLFAVVYDELRRMAGSVMRSERSDHTLQPTALVHEAYVRLAEEPGSWSGNRSYFLAIASTAMRRILVEHARSHNAQKRGSGKAHLSLDDIDAATPESGDGVDFVLLDDALARLSAVDPRQARIVELRFFGGLTVEETAAVVGISPRTVKREWQMSRAWLRREMASLGPDASGSR
jgi:RNA polymerase sigma factor (TIGR02999 family)